MSDQHTTVQYQLRLSEDLREQIKNIADRNKRSMNAEIVARLEATLEQDDFMQYPNGFFDMIDAVKEAESNANHVLEEYEFSKNPNVRHVSFIGNRIIKRLDEISEKLDKQKK